MQDLMKLYDLFRKRWPLSLIEKMGLPEYSTAKRKAKGELDTFTYWIEAKLQDLGSIWGGSSFKFGIYSRNDVVVKENKAGRMFTPDYAWYSKYGASAEEAFAAVKAEVIKVIEAAQRGDLDAIEEVDLGVAYKWKIAFHYQADIHNPTIINIFDPDALRFASGKKSKRICDLQRAIAASKGSESVFEYTRKLWADYQASLVPEIVDSPENRQESLNTIYYGPPGTGKTFQVLQFLRRVDAEEKAAEPKARIQYLDPNATFWHIAPGEGGYLWDELKVGNRLGYEWCGTNLGDLKMYDSSNKHAAIIKRFAQVRSGDFFAVISGTKLLGLAKAKHDYDFSMARSSDFDFQTVEVEWLEKFEIPILMNSYQTMTFCRMNGGSRWDSLVRGLEERGYRIGRPRSGEAEQKPASRNHLLVTFHQSYSYEDFIQGIKPVMDESDEVRNTEGLSYTIEPGVFYKACDYACQKAGFADLDASLAATADERREKFAQAKPFYLVIDEINRGNVANIFGELITLVEADKRLGNANETMTDLPYSKKRFGVPANLFLIGTMNTADRSVEALDSALRRRFAFKATYPQPKAIIQPEDFEIDLARMLTAVNIRIEQVLDRDHTIGQAYFTGIKDSDDPLAALVEAFRRKVVPQLEEYFFNAPERIRHILGKSFVIEQTPEYVLFDDEEGGERRVWSVIFPSTDTEGERAKAIEAFKNLYGKAGS